MPRNRASDAGASPKQRSFSVPQFDKFDADAEPFASYLERFECFVNAYDIPEGKSTAILLTCLGPAAYAQLRKWTIPDKPKDLPYRTIITKLREFSRATPSVSTERNRLRDRKQRPGEPFAEFLSELKSIAGNCGFEDVRRLEEEVRDQIVHGIHDSRTQAYFLQQPSLTLNQVIAKAQSDEHAVAALRTLKGTASLDKLSHDDKKKPQDPGAKMSEEDLPEKPKTPKQVDQKPHSKAGNDEVPETIHSSSTVYDSLDETALKPSSGVPALKKNVKTSENFPKIGFVKSDNRFRQKVASDVRWGHFGNGSNESKWYNSEKLEKSQSDLSSSKLFSNADSSVKSEYSHKSQTQLLNSSESDIFPSGSGMSFSPNETTYPKPHYLFKSSSSSQLPSVRGNYSQSNRHYKYLGNSTTRPVSVISMQQPYVSNSLYLSNHTSYGRHFCSCGEAYGKKTNRTESILSLAEDVETPEGLSWRRLHMSRAKLKATATTSELLSGFAMVAMVELQINKPTAVPEWLFVLFAVCTTILVSVHIFALMISTYLLPNIDAVSKLHVSSLVTESPHDRMKSFIELAWAFSTILGLFLFLVEIAILCWVKFWDYSFTAAMSATMIIMPVLVLFVAFAMHFYHSLVVIKCKTSVSNMQELENMKRQLDSVSPA